MCVAFVPCLEDTVSQQMPWSPGSHNLSKPFSVTFLVVGVVLLDASVGVGPLMVSAGFWPVVCESL